MPNESTPESPLIPVGPTSRSVRLVDNRVTPRILIAAEIIRDFPSEQIAAVETAWAPARMAGVAWAESQGRHVEHGHWDWRRKIDSVRSSWHRIISVVCEEEVQGLMAVWTRPRISQLASGNKVLYLDFLESAPWNLKDLSAAPKFFGTGSVLISEAIQLSREAGLAGRVGLHSLPQAEEIYRNSCGMTRFGVDEAYYDLVYFEYTEQQAQEWLTLKGLS